MILGKHIVRGGLVALALIFFAQPVAGQSSIQAFVTWKADSFVPADAAIKAIPTKGSQISAGVEALEAGRPIDLSKTEIRWYVNDRFLKSGIGMATITFPAEQLASRYDLRAVLKQVRGADISKTVQIPMTSPIVVIDGPYAYKIAPAELRLTARPYFFGVKTIDNFLVTWKVNGGTLPVVSDNPLVANLSLAGVVSNQSVLITAEAVSPADQFQRAHASLNLRIK